MIHLVCAVQLCLALTPHAYPLWLDLGAMSHTAKIDTLQDDRGLLTCFQAANIEEGHQQAFIKGHGITTLDDFIYLVDTKDWEASLKDLLAGLKEVAGNRLAQARFRAAYEAGLAAIKHSQSQPKNEESADVVLPDSTMAQVSRDWKRQYGVVLDPHVDPSDALRR